MIRILAALMILTLNACSTQLTKSTDTQYALVAPEQAAQPLYSYHPAAPAPNNDWPYPQEGIFPSISRYIKQGIASWYGPGFHGKKTATGEIFDMFALTAAHKTLPIPCYAEITNLENNRSIVVRINDRGPFVRNRELDLSYGAAKTLDMAQDGTGKIEIKTLTDTQALPKLHELALAQEQDVYLQIGSFGSVKKALQLKDKIAGLDLPEPDIRPSTYRNATLYKVQLGPIHSPADADQLNQQLAKIGITDTQFVTESKQSANTRATM
ncbi:MAG: septal ring lytic transglycosylase RlpA family protein [Methylococcaceae bacterium]|nr:septal ring lytic transglycosylase RlpA family protein [Methylococcaceae bacterium]